MHGCLWNGSNRAGCTMIVRIEKDMGSVGSAVTEGEERSWRSGDRLIGRLGCP